MKDIVRKIFRIGILMAGIALVLISLYLLRVSLFNSGFIIALVLGIFMSLYGIFFNYINEKCKTGVFRILKYIVIVGIVFVCFIISLATIYGRSDNVTYKEDAIVVLGAAVVGNRVSAPLAYRLQSAIKYYEKNPNVMIVVTGGQGFQEIMPESVAMEKYLIDGGIPQSSILKETKSTNTYENFLFAKEVMDSYFDKESYSIAVVTNNFHVYRATQLAKIATGIKEVTHLGAKTAWYSVPINYLREVFAILKLWILRK